MGLEKKKMGDSGRKITNFEEQGLLKEAAEAELRSEHNKYMHLKEADKLYNRDVNRTAQLQNQILESLDHEKTLLSRDLQRITNPTARKKDRDYCRTIEEYKYSHEELVQLIEEERRWSQKLDSKLVDMEQELRGIRATKHDKNDGYQQNLQMAKKKRHLEKMVEKANYKFSTQLCKNAKLREGIDECRRERDIYQKLYKKLIYDLELIKDEIFFELDNATKNFENRDEAMARVKAVQENIRKDMYQYMNDQDDLNRIISNEIKVKNFMAKKEFDRSLLKVDDPVRKPSNAEASLVAEQKLIQSYEESFQKIKQAAGEEDVDTVIKNFMDTESKNFALYKFVNELRDEIEKMQDTMSIYRKNMEKYLTEDIRLSSFRKATMKEQESKLNSAGKAVEKADIHYRKMNKVLDVTLANIRMIFKSLKCSDDSIKAMIGKNASLNVKNVMLYLGVIEEKVQEYLNTMHFKKFEVNSVSVAGIKRPDLGRRQDQNKNAEKSRVPSPLSVRIEPPPANFKLDPVVSYSEETEVAPVNQLDLRNTLLHEIDRADTNFQQSPSGTHIVSNIPSGEKNLTSIRRRITLPTITNHK